MPKTAVSFHSGLGIGVRGGDRFPVPVLGRAHRGFEDAPAHELRLAGVGVHLAQDREDAFVGLLRDGWGIERIVE